MCAGSTPASSSTETASSAISATVYGPGTRSLRPTPRLSKLSTRRPASTSTGTVRHQPVALIPRPMTRRTGGPEPPVSSQWSLTRRSARDDRGPRAASLVVAALLDLRLQLGHDVGVAQRRHVAELAPLGDVAQQPPHDLARARLREVLGPDDALRPGQLPDPLGHVL